MGLHEVAFSEQTVRRVVSADDGWSSSSLPSATRNSLPNSDVPPCVLFLVFVGTGHHPRCYGLYIGLRVLGLGVGLNAVGLGLDVGLRVVGLGVGLCVVGLDVDGLPVGVDVAAPKGGEVLAAV